MKNILVTGGAGFIGSNLILKLTRIGYTVTVLDNLSKQIHGNNPELDSPLFQSIKDKVVFKNGSVTSREDWESVIHNQDAIIHLAAETGTGQSMYCIEKYVEVNELGTAIMLDILTNKRHQVKKVIIASSRSIYGEGKYMHPDHGIVYPNARSNDDMLKGDFRVKIFDDKDLELLPTDENSKIHPSSVYGITKQNQEQLILTVCSTIGIPAVSLRYQNVYGPGQSLSNPYTGILSIFSTQIRNGNDIQVFEDGNESRHFVFIDDVVDATILALEYENSGCEIFNVGSGIPTSVLQVASTLIKEYNSDTKITISGKFRLGDIRHNYACLEKIHKSLGFIPKVKFNEGINRFVTWVLSQKIESDMLSESLKEMAEKGLIK